MLNLIGTLAGPVAGILDKFIEDKDKKAALAHEIATMAEKHAHVTVEGIGEFIDRELNAQEAKFSRDVDENLAQSTLEVSKVKAAAALAAETSIHYLQSGSHAFAHSQEH